MATAQNLEGFRYRWPEVTAADMNFRLYIHVYKDSIFITQIHIDSNFCNSTFANMVQTYQFAEVDQFDQHIFT